MYSTGTMHSDRSSSTYPVDYSGEEGGKGSYTLPLQGPGSTNLPSWDELQDTSEVDTRRPTSKPSGTKYSQEPSLKEMHAQYVAYREAIKQQEIYRRRKKKKRNKDRHSKESKERKTRCDNPVHYTLDLKSNSMEKPIKPLPRLTSASLTEKSERVVQVLRQKKPQSNAERKEIHANATNYTSPRKHGSLETISKVEPKPSVPAAVLEEQQSLKMELQQQNDLIQQLQLQVETLHSQAKPFPSPVLMKNESFISPRFNGTIQAYGQWLSEQITNLSSSAADVAKLTDYPFDLNSNFPSNESKLQHLFRRQGISMSSFYLRPNAMDDDEDLGRLASKLEDSIASLGTTYYELTIHNNRMHRESQNQLRVSAEQEKQEQREQFEAKLQEEQSTHDQKHEILKTQHQCQLREQHTESQQKLNELQLELRRCQQENENLKQQTLSDKEHGKQEMEYLEYRLKTDFEKAARDIQQEHQKELKNVEHEATAKAEQKITELEEKLAEASTENMRLLAEGSLSKKELLDVRNRNLKLEQIHEKEFHSMEINFQKQMEELRRNHDATLRSIHEQTKKLTSEHNRYVARLKSEHDAQLQEIQQQTEIKTKEQHENQQQELKQQLARLEENLQHKFQQQIDALTLQNKELLQKLKMPVTATAPEPEFSTGVQSFLEFEPSGIDLTYPRASQPLNSFPHCSHAQIPTEMASNARMRNSGGSFRLMQRNEAREMASGRTLNGSRASFHPTANITDEGLCPESPERPPPLPTPQYPAAPTPLKQSFSPSDSKQAGYSAQLQHYLRRSLRK